MRTSLISLLSQNRFASLADLDIDIINVAHVSAAMATLPVTLRGLDPS